LSRSFGPIRRNVRKCVRCEDELAQSPERSVFALGQECIDEVYVLFIERGERDENGSHIGYAVLMSKYGYREAR
jgi:hypothetical protein